VTITTAHQAQIAVYRRNPNWKTLRPPSMMQRDISKQAARLRTSRANMRLTASFEFTGPAMDPAAAQQLLDSWCITRDQANRPMVRGFTKRLSDAAIRRALRG
jgi:hypothetical protein